MHWDPMADFLLVGEAHASAQSLSRDERHTLHATSLFAVFVIANLFNLLVARRPHGGVDVLGNFDKSTLGHWVLGATVVLLVTMVQLGGELTGTAPLSVEQWMRATAVGATSLPVGLAVNSTVGLFGDGVARARRASSTSSKEV